MKEYKTKVAKAMGMYLPAILQYWFRTIAVMLISKRLARACQLIQRRQTCNLQFFTWFHLIKWTNHTSGSVPACRTDAASQYHNAKTVVLNKGRICGAMSNEALNMLKKGGENRADTYTARARSTALKLWIVATLNWFSSIGNSELRLCCLNIAGPKPW